MFVDNLSYSLISCNIEFIYKRVVRCMIGCDNMHDSVSIRRYILFFQINLNLGSTSCGVGKMLTSLPSHLKTCSYSIHVRNTNCGLGIFIPGQIWHLYTSWFIWTVVNKVRNKLCKLSFMFLIILKSVLVTYIFEDQSRFKMILYCLTQLVFMN